MCRSPFPLTTHVSKVESPVSNTLGQSPSLPGRARPILGRLNQTAICPGLEVTAHSLQDQVSRREIRSLRNWPRESRASSRSEEHTSELQSRQYLVCRLLLE